MVENRFFFCIFEAFEFDNQTIIHSKREEKEKDTPQLKSNKFNLYKTNQKNNKTEIVNKLKNKLKEELENNEKLILRKEKKK